MVCSLAVSTLSVLSTVSGCYLTGVQIKIITTGGFVMCSLMTSWLCDETRLWRVDRVTTWPCEEMTGSLFTTLSLIIHSDSQPFRSGANSLPRANWPIELWPIRSLELSLPGPFVPWPIRSWLSRALELCSQERNGSGTFVPLVHDVDTWYSNYTSPNFRPTSVAAKWLHGSRYHLVCR